MINRVKCIAPEQLRDFDYDFIFIAVADPKSQIEIKKSLRKVGVLGKMIVNVLQMPEYMFLFEDQRTRWISGMGRYVKENNTAGNVTECGVCKGECARFINDAFPERKLYLFIRLMDFLIVILI